MLRLGKLNRISFLNTPRIITRTKKSKSVDEQIIYHGDRKDINAVLHIYSKLIQSEVAPSSKTITLIMEACAKAKELDKAFQVYKSIEDQGIEITTEIYNSLMKVCIETNNLDRGNYLFEKMNEKQIQPDIFTFHRLIQIAGKSKKMGAIENIKKSIQQLGLEYTVGTYNILIQTAIQNNNKQKANEYFNEMKSKNYYPNEDTYSLLIENTENVKKAFEYLEEMKENKIRANTQVYNSFLKICARESDIQSSLTILNIMEKRKVKINRITYNSVLASALMAKNFEIFFTIHDTMKSANILPNLTTVNLLISCYCAQEKLDQAEKVLDEVISISPFSPSINTFNILFKSCVLHNNVKVCKKLMKTMENLNIQPNNLTKKYFAHFFPDSYSIDDLFRDNNQNFINNVNQNENENEKSFDVDSYLKNLLPSDLTHHHVTENENQSIDHYEDTEIDESQHESDENHENQRESLSEDHDEDTENQHENENQNESNNDDSEYVSESDDAETDMDENDNNQITVDTDPNKSTQETLQQLNDEVTQKNKEALKVSIKNYCEASGIINKPSKIEFDPKFKLPNSENELKKLNIHYRILLQLFCENEECDKGLQIIDFLKEKQFLLRPDDYNCVIIGLGKSQEVERITSVVKTVFDIFGEIGLSTFNSTISALGHCNALVNIPKIFREMNDSNVAPDISTYTIALTAFSMSQNPTKELLVEIISFFDAHQIELDDKLFNLLTFCFSHVKDVNSTIETYVEMKTEGFTPDVIGIGAVLSALNEVNGTKLDTDVDIEAELMDDIKNLDDENEIEQLSLYMTSLLEQHKMKKE